MSNLAKQDQNRLRLFKRYGYDIPKARSLIFKKAKISGGKILEVGTGRGHMGVALAKNGLKVVSIDLDRKAQKIAKLNLKSLKLDKSVSLKHMDAEKLKYKDNSFDFVISVNFIHHAKNPVKCLKEMIRVVKNKLIIADLNKRGERVMEKMISKKVFSDAVAAIVAQLEYDEAVGKHLEAISDGYVIFNSGPALFPAVITRWHWHNSWVALCLFA